jgi:hypothetical protein
MISFDVKMHAICPVVLLSRRLPRIIEVSQLDVSQPAGLPQFETQVVQLSVVVSEAARQLSCAQCSVPSQATQMFVARYSVGGPAALEPQNAARCSLVRPAEVATPQDPVMSG